MRENNREKYMRANFVKSYNIKSFVITHKCYKFSLDEVKTETYSLMH